MKDQGLFQMVLDYFLVYLFAAAVLGLASFRRVWIFSDGWKSNLKPHLHPSQAPRCHLNVHTDCHRLLIRSPRTKLPHLGAASICLWNRSFGGNGWGHSPKVLQASARHESRLALIASDGKFSAASISCPLSPPPFGMCNFSP